MLRCLLLTAAACLAIATPASATIISYTDEGRGPVIAPAVLAISEAVAAEQFPGSPCADRISLVVNGDPDSFTRISSVGAYLGDCRLVIGVPDDEEMFCMVFVHEYGHAAMEGTRADHASSIAQGVMGGFARSDYAPCVRALAAYQRAREVVEPRLAAGTLKKRLGSRWRVHCALAAADTVTDCRASRRRTRLSGRRVLSAQRRHYRVTRDGRDGPVVWWETT